MQIQKKEYALFFKDFRPIDMSTPVYKIIAKVLAERLKKVMPSVISPYQSALLKGNKS